MIKTEVKNDHFLPTFSMCFQGIFLRCAVSWRKFYNQVGSTTAFQACTLGDCNINADADNFLDFDSLSETGPYRFKLEWEKNNVIRSLEWTQALHPLAATDQDMSPTDIVWSHGGNCPTFKVEVAFCVISHPTLKNSNPMGFFPKVWDKNPKNIL